MFAQAVMRSWNFFQSARLMFHLGGGRGGGGIVGSSRVMWSP